MTRQSAISKSPSRKVSPSPAERRYELVQGKLSYHWLNRHGRFVRLEDIPDYGIRKILHALEDAEDRVPFVWIQTLRLHAERRGILEETAR